MLVCRKILRTYEIANPKCQFLKRGETIANCTEGKAPTFCTTLISTAAIAHLRFLDQRSL